MVITKIQHDRVYKESPRIIPPQRVYKELSDDQKILIQILEELKEIKEQLKKR